MSSDNKHEMDILKLIKNRATIRKYKDSPIPENIINKIVEAGLWASSVHGFQPWRFVVVSNHALLKKISSILLRKSREIRSSTDKLLTLTANTVANAPVAVLVYNRNVFKDVARKYYQTHKKEVNGEEAVSGIRIAEYSEIEAISGAIQNMILLANNLGVGSCWNTIPLFCEREINKLIGNGEQLIAIITMGYPSEKGTRSKRYSIDSIVQYKY